MCAPLRWRRYYLAYMDFARQQWMHVSCNIPGNAEIKCRPNVVGIFPNDAVSIRLVSAMMIAPNDEATVTCRHLVLKSLADITDTHNVRLPAVAS